MRTIAGTHRARAARAAATAALAAAIVAGLGACSGDGDTGGGTSPGAPDPAAGSLFPSGPRIVFRNTEPGADAGRVASVPLTDPAATRILSPLSCLRVDATRAAVSCMNRITEEPVGHRETLYDGGGAEILSWPLPGAPSRTRLSPDGRLAAWTAFVDGESYSGVTFSTLTMITEVHGTYYGPLDAFTFLVDGAASTQSDLNFWGVTFAGDDNTFYATAASAGRTWLVRGNLRGRTVSAIREGVECPSLSPDATRIAFKKNLGTADAPHWTLAVYDLRSGAETVLPLNAEVDDQAEWLDDETLLFGVPAATAAAGGAADDANIFSVAADGSAPEKLFLAHASSPAVMR